LILAANIAFITINVHPAFFKANPVVAGLCFFSLLTVATKTNAKAEADPYGMTTRQLQVQGFVANEWR
jgi:hypothetical protein